MASFDSCIAKFHYTGIESCHAKLLGSPFWKLRNKHPDLHFLLEFRSPLSFRIPISTFFSDSDLHFLLGFPSPLSFQIRISTFFSGDHGVSSQFLVGMRLLKCDCCVVVVVVVVVVLLITWAQTTGC